MGHLAKNGTQIRHRDGMNGTQSGSNGARDIVRVYVNGHVIGLCSPGFNAEHRPMGHHVQNGNFNRKFRTLYH